jgi:transposase
MRLVYRHCAGLDVHKKTVSVCIRGGQGDQVQVSTALFGTFTEDLERLREFLRGHKVHRVVIAYASHCTSVGR